MKLSLLTPRDTKTNIMFTLSFTVSFGPPTEISCKRHGSNPFFTQAMSVGSSTVVYREVIRSRYINSSYPDMTRVIFTRTTPRESSTYSCTVYVTSRTGVGIIDSYEAVEEGSGTSTASITGECCTLLTTIVLLLLPSVASPPTAVTASRITLTAANITWSAPSPSPAGYEVFYHDSSDNVRVSAVNTTATSFVLSGLTPGVSYSVFVLSYGAVGAPVLPSALIKVTVTSESL